MTPGLVGQEAAKLPATEPVLVAGAPLGGPLPATAAMVMLHGRGGRAEDVLALAGELDRPGLAYLAPQAAGSTWYPYSFLAPLEQNEPWLSASLRRVGELIAGVEAAGVPAELTVLLGFSQGACLALEFARRQPRRYGGVVGLSGGLIGPRLEAAGSAAGSGGLDETPVFLGCSDRDPHIPAERVEESARLLAQMGGRVTRRFYPGLGHTVNADEIAFVRQLLASLVPRPGGAPAGTVW
jgi:phospholipase/carboxylesterase